VQLLICVNAGNTLTSDFKSVTYRHKVYHIYKLNMLSQETDEELANFQAAPTVCQSKIARKKGQPGARSSSRLRRVRGRVRPFLVLCTQSFPAFLQEAVPRSPKKIWSAFHI
jgi:hypothetical protein